MLEIKVEIPADATDAADNVLLESGKPEWSVFEDVIAGRAWMIGIYPQETDGRAQWERLVPHLDAAGVPRLAEPVYRSLGVADWRDSYKAHFKAWQFGRLHWVPVWERDTYSVPAGDAVLWLDPGLAFGTGNHETTRLCVERLVALAQVHGPRSHVVDAGCGSGILALSAALLGCADVMGFDNDPEAIRVSEENAALNGLNDRVHFFVADIPTGLAGRSANILLANIQADVLLRFARELVGAVGPGGALVLSGILAAENGDIRSAFEALTPGWTVNARTMGEWSDVLLVRARD